MELRHLETLSRSPRKARSPRRPTRWTPCSRTCPTRCASSRPSSACRCSCAAAGAPSPPSSASLVLDRARRVAPRARGDARRPLDAPGLEAGHARLGVVGTASRWLVPALVADLRERAPGVRLRVNEGASERLFAEVVEGELAQAVVTEPVNDRRLVVDHLLDEDLVGARRPRRTTCPTAPVPLAAFAALPLVLPPEAQPAAHRARGRRREPGLTLHGAGRGRGHPAHRRPGRGRRLRVDPARDRDPARARRTRARSRSRTCRRAASRSSARATRSCRSPTRRCATACSASSSSTCVACRGRRRRTVTREEGVAHGAMPHATAVGTSTSS